MTRTWVWKNQCSLIRSLRFFLYLFTYLSVGYMFFFSTNWPSSFLKRFFTVIYQSHSFKMFCTESISVYVCMSVTESISVNRWCMHDKIWYMIFLIRSKSHFRIPTVESLIPWSTYMSCGLNIVNICRNFISKHSGITVRNGKTLNFTNSYPINISKKLTKLSML